MALYTHATCTGVRAFLRQVLRSNKIPVFYCPASQVLAHRTLLSDAYKGTGAWRTRKLLAANMEELKINLDADFFDLKKPVSSVDLHKFIDNISEEQDVESAEKYFYSYRHSPVAHHLRASTVHCFIRICIDLGLTKTALKLLQGKTNYGLFLDNFTFNLLLDDNTQRGDVKSAARVAMEMMTSEVLTNEEPLSQLLALHACHEFLKSEQYTEEEVHDLGMTIADATRGHASLVSSSYHVLGLVMAGRLKQAVGFLQAALNQSEREPCLVQEAVKRLQGLVENQAKANQELKDELQDSISQLKASDRISTETLDSLVTSKVLPQIEELQQNQPHSEGYPRQLDQWHSEHVEAARKQIMAAREYDAMLKRKKLEKLLEATGGLKYWLQREKRRQQEAAGSDEGMVENSGEENSEMQSSR